MTLKQIEVFLAVAATNSFSRGGETVSLAQSTVSQHIRALEEELGLQLFNRAGTEITLTEGGRLFHEQARKISRACERARTCMRRFAGLEEAVLRVGTSTALAVSLIPDLLGHFIRKYPGVRFELHQYDSHRAVKALLDDEVELALTGGMFDDDHIEFDRLIDERIIFVTRPDTLPPGNVADADIAKKLPLLIREPGSGTRQAVESALRQSGLSLSDFSVAAQLGSEEAIRRAVLAGAGCAFISSLVVARELAENQLVEHPLLGMKIHRSFYCAIRRGHAVSPAAARLIEMMKEMFPAAASHS